MVPVEEGVFQATYVPAAEGKCKVDVKYGGAEVPNRSAASKAWFNDNDEVFVRHEPLA